MGRFFDKFNMYSDGEFSFLRLSCVNVYLSSQTAEFCFVCPENEFNSAISAADDIQKSVEKAIESHFKITVKITKSHFDEHFFTLNLIKFFSYYVSLKGCLDKRNVKYDFDLEKAAHKVTITLKQSAYHVFCGRGLMRELTEFVRSNYCENIEVHAVLSDEAEQLDESYTEEYSYDDRSGRFIRVVGSDGFIGYTIYDPASYICDATPCEEAVLCGKIKDIKELARKPKDGKEKPNFYKFILDDTTGSIEAVYFPTEKTKDKLTLLKVGSTIIASGKLEFNEFNDRKTLTFYPRRISLCGFPNDFKINRLKLNIPEKYKTIFPKMYSEYEQASFFGIEDRNAEQEINIKTELEVFDTNPDDKLLNAEMADKKQDAKAKTKSKAGKRSEVFGGNYKDNINFDFFKGKTFCVFDIETTGLDRHNDKIIEIGAVKIENGILTQTFSTLIDPQVLLPKKIINITGIKDIDLKDACLLEEILPDLLKFFGDSILVGYNSESFDYPFLSNAAVKYNAYFDNERFDVYLLAKKYLALDQYQLKDIAAYFNVINPNAHRALDDAVTTAKIFMALSGFFDSEL